MKTIQDVEKVIVLDFGSQYGQLITRRLRELNVYSELLPSQTRAEDLEDMGNVKGLILSSGPYDANQERLSDFDPDLLNMKIPILGIGYGMELLNQLRGGSNTTARQHEEGHVEINFKALDSQLFAGMEGDKNVFLASSHRIDQLAEGFQVAAESKEGTVMAIQDEDLQLYGTQFHPEIHHTEGGQELLNRFVHQICQADNSWSMDNYIDLAVERIREEVGSEKVLLGLSGGVDSSVVGVLLQRAIGDQLTCIFVDHGLLRKDEAQHVMESLSQFGLHIIKVDAKDRFFEKLKGVSDPEQKRKIIGNEFVYVFDEEADKLEGIKYLAQGTLYTDIIESGVGNSAVIKSHHNVGGLPEDMEFQLLEPLNTLFKDEVRALGTALGMPDSIVWRQPFPGPGLGIRVLGEITDEKVEIVRESDAILREEIAKHGLDRDIWQYFTVLPNVRSVGVKDDQRTYDHMIGIRAVTSVDGLTSEFARIPWEVLHEISLRIIQEVPHVNRVVYDVTGKPPSTIEWE